MSSGESSRVQLGSVPPVLGGCGWRQRLKRSGGSGEAWVGLAFLYKMLPTSMRYEEKFSLRTASFASSGARLKICLLQASASRALSSTCACCIRVRTQDHTCSLCDAHKPPCEFDCLTCWTGSLSRLLLLLGLVAMVGLLYVFVGTSSQPAMDTLPTLGTDADAATTDHASPPAQGESKVDCVDNALHPQSHYHTQ